MVLLQSIRRLTRLLWHAAAEQLVNGSKQGITVRSAVCRRDEGAGRGRHVTLAHRVAACNADHRSAIFKHAPRTAEAMQSVLRN